MKDINVDGLKTERVLSSSRPTGAESCTANVRRAACDAMGDFVIRQADRSRVFEVLLDLQDGRRRPFLKMKNPSVGVYHIEGAAPECHTVAEALAWRNQSDVPPSVLT